MHLSPLLSHGFQRPLHRIASRLRRRHLLIPCILVTQTLLLALIFLSARAIEALPAGARPIRIFDVRVPADKPLEPVPRPEPVEPLPQPEQFRLESPIPEIDLKLEALALPAQPVFSAAAAARAGFGTTCDVSETLARAFAEDEFIKGELTRIGPESRSVSNAIMFWDADWVELPGNAPEDVVQTLRRAIVEGVRAAPAECLAQELAGPRFIFVRDTSPTLILVIGSGAWRWEQLLSEAENAPEATRLTRQWRKD